MNERFKELSKQAVDYASACEAEAWDGAYERKFAELIVRECAELAKHHVMNISTYGDAEFVDEQIKQHFGVEE